MSDEHSPPVTPKVASTFGQWDVVHQIERAVSSVRWLLLLPYLSLVAALIMYELHLVHEVIEMAKNYMANIEEQNILLLFGLELLDMTLIAQLFVMTIQGGFAIFILPLDKTGSVLPQWLKHGLSTSDQKIKFGMSIINIMLVQILDMFIKGDATQGTLWMREQMLMCAIGGTLAFCLINILMHPEMLRKRPHDDHTNDKDHQPHA